MKIVTKNVLLDLVKSYDREGAWAKLEALYISAISNNGFYNARRNIEIRYGTYKPVEEIELDIVRLCSEDRIPYETEDTGERCGAIIAEACEQVFPKFLTDKVSKSVPSLSVIAKRFVFLLHKEGSILSGGISTMDESVLSHFTSAYKIIFGELEGDEYKVHEEVFREMTVAGLAYECFSRSRKHFYCSLIVPPFARKVWADLPNIIPLPAINVEEVW